jgi:antitoxin component of RelBE/YafQ-DinJ toxin-antitoxin module
MRNEYDFSHSRKNPYVKQLKRQITIRLDTMAVNYFKEMAAELGMPYQNLINMFLRDCAIQKRRPVIQWPQDVTGHNIHRLRSHDIFRLISQIRFRSLGGERLQATVRPG